MPNKRPISILVVSALIAVAVFLAPALRAGQQVDLRKLLKQADEAGRLPAGVVVRVRAHMFWRAGTSDETEFKESWEVTTDEVHRVVREAKNNKAVYRREESLTFDSKRLCRDLARGSMLRIRHNRGPGKPVRFALTDYDRGKRSIEILVNGERVIHLGESHLTAGYREPHARDFATLYEKLASQARAAFAGFRGRDVLLKAAKDGTWPKGMDVRLGAGIYRRNGGKFEEDWEFSEGKVHRIVIETPEKGDIVRRRERSLTFDTNAICNDLIDGRAFEIQADESIEEGLLLADMEEALGGRYIEVLIGDECVLELCEHCTGALYGVTHAHAFAELYERLASQARAAFAVVGTYEWNHGNRSLGFHAGRMVILDNGVVRFRQGDVKFADEKWKMGADGELHVESADGRILLYRINRDNSLTHIGYIIDGQRVMHPKDEQRTHRKIK